MNGTAGRRETTKENNIKQQERGKKGDRDKSKRDKIKEQEER